MKKLNLDEIIKQSGLTVTAVGEALFPDNKMAYKAIHRIIKGEGLLNTEQLVKLSALVNRPIADLFT
jgi:hypothetical protein